VNAWVGGNLLSNGCIIEGIVERSVLSPGVRVSAGAVVRDSVIMNDTVIAPKAKVERAIIDKGVYIGEGAEVCYGVDNVPNLQFPDRLNTGLTVIGKQAHIPAGIKIGHNVIINPRVDESRFQTEYVSSGEVV
jgi:glucose-1-phosphate adenylyltransferase